MKNTELVFLRDGAEVCRLSIRSHDEAHQTITTNRLGRRPPVPRGAEIQTPDGEIVGAVVSFRGIGGCLYEIVYESLTVEEVELPGEAELAAALEDHDGDHDWLAQLDADREVAGGDDDGEGE